MSVAIFGAEQFARRVFEVQYGDGVAAVASTCGQRGIGFNPEQLPAFPAHNGGTPRPDKVEPVVSDRS